MADRRRHLGLLATVWICGLAMLEGCGETSKMMLAPISTTGSLQTTASTRRTADGASSHSVQQTANVGVRSYLWHPWFATLDGDLNFTYDKSFGEENRRAIRAGGSGTLNVLPQSRYPVSVGFAHTDSRASGEFSAFDVTRDRASLTASASFSQSFNGRLRASWDRSDRDGSGVRNAQNLGFDLSKSFAKDAFILGINNISFGAEFRHSAFAAADPDNEDRSATAGTLRLNISSKPFDDVTYNSHYTAIYDELNEDSDSLKRKSLQGFSTVQWRPREKPYVLTGSLRMLTEQLERQNGDSPEDTSTLLAAANVGLRWPVNDRLSVDLGLRGLFQTVDRGEGGAIGESASDAGDTINAGVIASANYNSTRRMVSNFDWSWNGRVQTDDGFDNEDGPSTRETLAIGHRFERFFDDLIFIPVRFSFAQGGTLGFDSSRQSAVTASLSESVSLAYSSAGVGSSTNAQLLLRDTRDLVGEKRELQIVQARVGRRVAINRDRRLTGDLSAQAVRQVSQEESDVSLSASGTATYTHRHLFDVENLGFRSELRIHLVNFEQVFARSDDDDESNELLRNDWRNIITYQIGRLTAALEMSAFQRAEGISFLGLLRLNRAFGK